WDAIVKAAEGFGKIFGKIFEGIKKVITGIWDGIVDGIKGAINFIIKGINAFIRGLNKIKIPDWVPGVGGKGLNIKEIPLLAEGGEIVQRGYAIVGEAGPELLELPQGAKVKALTPVDSNKEVAKEVNNNFNIANLVVREEADIKKIARELKKLQDTKRGGVAFA